MSWMRVLRSTTYWCISSSLVQRLVENSWNSAFMAAALKAMDARRIDVVPRYQCNLRGGEGGRWRGKGGIGWWWRQLGLGEEGGGSAGVERGGDGGSRRDERERNKAFRLFSY
jgi:hypothetical protein